MGLGGILLQLLAAVLIMGWMPLRDILKARESADYKLKAMKEVENPHDDGSSSNQLQKVAKDVERACAPERQSIAKANKQQSEGLFCKWVLHPLAFAIRWLDEHGGAVTAAATVAIACLTYYLAHDSRRQADSANGQLGVMKRQLDAMQAQTRPWLKGEFKLVKLSKGENGTLNAEIDVRFVNIGNYPAQIVWVGGAVLPNPGLHWQVKQKDLCDNVVLAWKNILKNPTNIAFPNEPSPWVRQFTFTPPIETTAWQNMVLMENGGKIPNPKPPWVFQIPLVFIGCITYSAGDLFDVHQTGFMLDFAKGMVPNGGPLDATFDVSGGGAREYDVSGVSLIQGFRGAFGN
jgi:hypothetical protein